MRKCSRRRCKPRSVPKVSLTPLIDTALTLLIIFMVTAPMMNNAIKVELPEGKAQEANNTPQELIVYIDKKENLFFNGVPVSMDKLVLDVQQAVGKDKGRTVFVKADEGARYGKVIETVDQIKVLGGVQYVALATKKAA